MFVRLLAAAAALVLSGCTIAAASSQASDKVEDARYSSDMVRFGAVCEDFDDWDKPTEPFLIHGNTYYVGTCGISAIFIDRGNGGFVLIDTGTETGARAVLNNIRALGLDISGPGDILQSHEHYDHVGGLAWMVQRLSATASVNADVANVYITGVADPRDPQAGMHEPMDPVDPSIIYPGKEIDYDGFVMRSIATPGHTPGALSWQWESCDDAGTCHTIVYADSLSPVSRDDYRFSNHPDYVAAFRAGLERVRDLKCDILLTPHPSASEMLTRARTGTMEGGMTCAEYADSKTKALDERLAKEAAGK